MPVAKRAELGYAIVMWNRCLKQAEETSNADGSRKRGVARQAKSCASSKMRVDEEDEG